MFLPLVSCLCVTERRAAFMPWLLWCFDRQSWPAKELVIVDSSAEPFQPEGRRDIRVVAAIPGANVASKRNLALGEARGEVVTWFDDDDWQHPRKLTVLVEALREGRPYAGSVSAWFVNLVGSRCTPYREPCGGIVFNSAGFRREAALPFRFREDITRAADALWMRQFAARYRKKAAVLSREDLFFWLCHDDNLSNPAGKRRFPERLEILKKRFGADVWGDTDEALASLKVRLQDQHMGHRTGQ